MFQTGLSKHAYMEIQTVLVREGAMAIMGKHFEHERIVLGGERYQGCTFINCELVYDGQPVQLLDTNLPGIYPTGLAPYLPQKACRAYSCGINNATAASQSPA